MTTFVGISPRMIAAGVHEGKVRITMALLPTISTSGLLVSLENWPLAIESLIVGNIRAARAAVADLFGDGLDEAYEWELRLSAAIASDSDRPMPTEQSRWQRIAVPHSAVLNLSGASGRGAP